MKSIPMADRRLGRSIVVVLSTALLAGYRSLQRSRRPRDPAARASPQTEPRRH